LLRPPRLRPSFGVESKRESGATTLEPADALEHFDEPETDAAEELFRTVRDLMIRFARTPRKTADVVAHLKVTPPQAKSWLKQLCDERVLDKRPKPVRYSVRQNGLFDKGSK